MAPEGCRLAWCDSYSDYDYEHEHEREHGIEAIKKTCTAIIVQVFLRLVKSVDINRGDMQIFFFKR
jgi:hypothetical protein